MPPEALERQNSCRECGYRRPVNSPGQLFRGLLDIGKQRVMVGGVGSFLAARKVDLAPLMASFSQSAAFLSEGERPASFNRCCILDSDKIRAPADSGTVGAREGQYAGKRQVRTQLRPPPASCLVSTREVFQIKSKRIPGPTGRAWLPIYAILTEAALHGR